MTFVPLTYKHLLALLAVYVLYKVQQRLSLSARRNLIIKEHGCKPVRRFPEIENPIFEWRFLFNTMKAYREHRLMDLIQDRYSRLGYTIRAKVMFRYIYHTAEPDNIKAILAVKFSDWNLPDARKHSFIPLLGQGIFTSDGTAWQHSRDLLRPNFSRTQVRDLDTFETHIRNLLLAIPRDGSTIDLQDLFFRLTIDSATEFLFGESLNTLAPGTPAQFSADFAETFTRAQAKVGEAARTMGLTGLLNRAQFKKDAAFIHNFVDRYIERRLKLKTSENVEKDGEERYVFLDELIKETQDPLRIRAELLNVLLAGRDTTASLLSNAWFVLAKRPDIWANLRAEVDQIGSELPTFEKIKEMKYLRAFLKESLRLHPVVPANSRMAVVDTVLPKGGGPDGESPLFIPKKTMVQYHIFAMHRRRDFYGDDAEEFRPERWETIRPGWEYLPFNGGPRICIGQQLALTEASYTTIRLIQEFSCIESRDDGPWEELLTLTMTSRNENYQDESEESQSDLVDSCYRMAALETPWIVAMASFPAHQENGSKSEAQNPPTMAAFSPSSSYFSSASKQRSTIVVHRKSPLLIATPPSITRALAFSHPFILPLNKLAGLISWTSGDPWESFLLVAAFWALVLYGDFIIIWAGPIVVVTGLILGMYSRRYSPLSSTGWTGEKKGHKRDASENIMKHQKSLDEIVDTLTIFTSRLNVLLEPFLQMTDFLSTQRTATSASTRPALTTLLIRIIFVTPIWVLLTLPPLHLITTRRVTLAIGTMLLSWHSRPARVARAILWRSRHIRHICSIATGLSLSPAVSAPPLRKGIPPPLPPRDKSQHAIAESLASNIVPESTGVRFTFVVFENQRRWIALGWTYSLMAYERGVWTDEHLHPSESLEEFRLPKVDGGTMVWRWVPGSAWEVEGAGKGKNNGNGDGWIYYDNKWNDGRRGQDGWNRWTRRRKWYRDAELVEVPAGLDETDATEAGTAPPAIDDTHLPEYRQTIKDSDDASSSQGGRRRRVFRKNSRASAKSSVSRQYVGASEDEAEHRKLVPHHDANGNWGVGDEIKMGLG